MLIAGNADAVADKPSDVAVVVAWLLSGTLLASSDLINEDDGDGTAAAAAAVAVAAAADAVAAAADPLSVTVAAFAV